MQPTPVAGNDSDDDDGDSVVAADPFNTSDDSDFEEVCYWDVWGYVDGHGPQIVPRPEWVTTDDEDGESDQEESAADVQDTSQQQQVPGEDTNGGAEAADDDSNESKDTTDFTFAPTNNSGSLRPAKSNTDLGTPRGNRSMIMTV